MNLVTAPAIENFAIQTFAVKTGTYTTALESYYALKPTDGKLRLGQIELKDRYGYWWQVKVRWTSDRGHYLKFKQKLDQTNSFRASADGYKLGKYRAITAHEWEIFAMLLDAPNNYALRNGSQNILNRLI